MSTWRRRISKVPPGISNRAVVANPRYAPALVGRGEALLGLGDRDQALKSLEAAVVADPGLAGLRSRIEVLRVRGLQDDVAAARKAADAGRLDEARKLYDHALAASPDSQFLYREIVMSRGGRATSTPPCGRQKRPRSSIRPTLAPSS
jgi:tetratricopeptide (TPR) repeat protein